ncbi:hypothetical protein [Xylocopilactobacillus apicola]|uniref:Uncharacterized protein n=1 Tax=Xylocopilactobacillus apicola TaxID=2932184 RepID=A0AAU9DSS6_9LACO|nr:hypothetical protein [Xylocopilactobacillus apicola]BDR59134.1 hypothetical protein XA3_15750 [Xylocopilactobacillus apicola]
MKRNFYQKIIEKYPTKYTPVRKFFYHYLEPIWLVAIIITIVGSFVPKLAGWGILAGAFDVVFVVVDLVVTILDNQQRKKGDPRGQYWNFIE